MFMIIPGYNFGTGMMRLSLLENLKMMDYSCDLSNGVTIDRAKMMTPYTQYEWNGVGQYMFALGIEIIVYGILAIGTDFILSYPLIHKTCLPDKNLPKREFEDDEDVKKEADRVIGGIPHGILVFIF